jgi:hypothetical protein
MSVLRGLAFDGVVRGNDTQPAPESDQLALRARAWAERTCREQGIPVRISDPQTIERVAAILRDGRAKTPQA